MAEIVDGRTVAFTRFNRYDREGYGIEISGEEIGDAGIPGVSLFAKALGVWVCCQEEATTLATVDEAARSFCVPRDLIWEAVENHTWLFIDGDGRLQLDGV